jgi:two-component system sensor histidine kinase/response regulator
MAVLKLKGLTVESETANILVIDDEVGMREGCRRALMPHGFRVSTAENGAEGLRKLREELFDLVLVDAMMPGMSGIELLERIHHHDPDILSVMITGYATVDLAAQAMKRGAHDFLPKPFTSDELLTVVQRGLAERKRRMLLRKREEREEEDHELERARQEIAKLDAIQSRFMLVVAHELRNPAGVIKNYVQLMRAGYVDEDEWDEYLEKLDLRASQLLDMLDDILELAHLKEMLGPSKLKPVETTDVLEEVVRQVQPAAAAKGLELVVRIRGKPSMMAQRAHLQSLWANLLSNAVRYTPSGRVKVTLFEKDGLIVSRVADTGIGISPEELARIFQEFYRSESAQAQVPLGTGLGLAIVSQIVRDYQGTIQVNSVPEQGTTFTICLPALGAQGQA